MTKISVDNKNYIAGHKGMVGSSCWRFLKKNGYKNLIGRNSSDLNLTNQKDVEKFFLQEKPDAVINAAAKVGGIFANTQYPYQFLMDNMQIQNNLINSSLNNNVSKFIFLGSSCIYPKHADQPLKENYLLSGPLEETNQWYAIAKISGVKLIESIRKQFGHDYVSLMPTNLYGPGDNYNLETSHVLAAMIRKFYEGKQNKSDSVLLWGSGTPLREFLHVDDLAQAIIIKLLSESSNSIYNVGSGEEISIKNLAIKIQRVIGYNGKIVWDNSKPDGTPRKLLDSSLISQLDWRPNINLDEGIRLTYEDFLKNL